MEFILRTPYFRILSLSVSVVQMYGQHVLRRKYCIIDWTYLEGNSIRVAGGGGTTEVQRQRVIIFRKPRREFFIHSCAGVSSKVQLHR